MNIVMVVALNAFLIRINMTVLRVLVTRFVNSCHSFLNICFVLFQGFCANGRCGTHDGQCRKLWGPTAVRSVDLCYGYNVRADTSLMGNCGYDRDRKVYLPCEQKYVHSLS